jgi:prepilin-type N-terminal cleavage/methylation domain-containing protein
VNATANKTGFTLLEVLIAAAIIVTIVSMVYGSYAATSESAEIYKSRMTQSQRVRATLQQIARQIRCCFVPERYNMTTDPEGADSNPYVLQDTDPMIFARRQTATEGVSDYFHSDPRAMGGEILRFVTTNAICCEQGQAGGLYEVAYIYDKYTATLLLSERTFVGTSKSVAKAAERQPLLENVARIELGFCDGKKWQTRWNFGQAKELPRAVRIALTVQEESHRPLRCSTAVYVSCHEAQPENTGHEGARQTETK